MEKQTNGAAKMQTRGKHSTIWHKCIFSFSVGEGGGGIGFVRQTTALQGYSAVGNGTLQCTASLLGGSGHWQSPMHNQATVGQWAVVPSHRREGRFCGGKFRCFVEAAKKSVGNFIHNSKYILVCGRPKPTPWHPAGCAQGW